MHINHRLTEEPWFPLRSAVFLAPHISILGGLDSGNSDLRSAEESNDQALALVAKDLVAVVRCVGRGRPGMSTDSQSREVVLFGGYGWVCTFGFAFLSKVVAQLWPFHLQSECATSHVSALLGQMFNSTPHPSPLQLFSGQHPSHQPPLAPQVSGTTLA